MKVPSAKRETSPAPPPFPPVPPMAKEAERLPPAEPELVFEPTPPPPPSDWRNNALALSPRVWMLSAAMSLERPKVTLPPLPPLPPCPPTAAEAPKLNFEFAAEVVVVSDFTSPAFPPPPPRLCRVIPVEELPIVMTSIGVSAVKSTSPPSPPAPPFPPKLKDIEPENLLPPEEEALLIVDPPIPPPPPTDWT